MPPGYNFNFDKMLVKPSAIMLILESRRSSFFTIGLAFDSLTYPFYVLDKVHDPFFEYCSGCVYRKKYEQGNALIGCPGGLAYLKNEGHVYSEFPVETISPDRKCQLYVEGKIRYVKHKEVVMPVKVPPFVLRVDKFSVNAHSIHYPYAFVLKPDPQTEDDYFKGAPFILGNVDSYGSVCLGDSMSGVSSTCTDLDKVVNAFFSFRRNNDYFNSTLAGDYRCIADYVRDLNAMATDAERADHISRFGNNIYSGFRSKWTNCSAEPEDKRFILPPNFKRIIVDQSQHVTLTDLNDNQFKLSGTLTNYTLEPVN